MTRRRVILCGDASREMIARALEQLARDLCDLADIVAVDRDLECDLGAIDADLVVVCGGDGALLSTARRMREHQKPVVGINYGYLGFLVSLLPEHSLAPLRALLTGAISEVPRMMLQVTITRANGDAITSFALNDVLLVHRETTHIVRLDCRIDGELVNSYHCDGLLVSTPVGSTGHGLAAGGPILHPELEAMVLIPLSPHALTNRPLVLSAGHTISLQLRQRDRRILASVDGQVVHHVSIEDTVAITRAPVDFRLVQIGPGDFYERLRTKLGWRGRPPVPFPEYDDEP